MKLLLFLASFPSPAFDLSPAELAAVQARARIEQSPESSAGHTDLALALSRRARETADPAFYEQAHAALDRARELDPDDFTARRVRAWVLLGQHRFEEGLELAKELNRQAPDDLTLYALLVDGHAALGNYAEAEEAAQWMLDLRPDAVPSLTRAAYLREVFGDLDGALLLMEDAYARIAPDETEDRAWTLAHIAHLHLESGELDLAERVLEQSLALFPEYHYALGLLARTKTLQGQHEQALEVERRHYESAPHPENLYELALAAQRAGDEEASTLFLRFEREALGEADGLDNANLALIHYYLEAPGEEHRAKALNLSGKERERRRDVETRLAHARALAANGRVDEARGEFESLLEVGMGNARHLYHAARVAAEAGDSGRALELLGASLAANGRSEVAEEARSLRSRLLESGR